MYLRLKKLEEGFTIVETLIVLAIAALIITIVLIAVPDLQRSARNSNMLHDAQNVASAVQNYESNNQGATPGYVNKVGSTVTINGGTNNSSAATSTAQVQTNDKVIYSTSANSLTYSDVKGTIIVDVGYDCNTVNNSGSTSGSTGSVNGSSLTPYSDSRAVAIYYPIEPSSVGCVQE